MIKKKLMTLCAVRCLSFAILTGAAASALTAQAAEPLLQDKFDRGSPTDLKPLEGAAPSKPALAGDTWNVANSGGAWKSDGTMALSSADHGFGKGSLVFELVAHDQPVTFSAELRLEPTQGESTLGIGLLWDPIEPINGPVRMYIRQGKLYTEFKQTDPDGAVDSVAHAVQLEGFNTYSITYVPLRQTVVFAYNGEVLREGTLNYALRTSRVGVKYDFVTKDGAAAMKNFTVWPGPKPAK